MKCSYCEKEITKDENFYEIDREQYLEVRKNK